MSAEKAVELGTRRELFVDDAMIASLEGYARRVLHAPRPREIVMTHDRPWEGNTCCYFTFFHDGSMIRAYYRGSQSNPRLTGGPDGHQVICIAESDDGIQWRKPALGLFDFQGSVRNNIVHDGAARHNLAPFLDQRPDCPAEQRYKALGGKKSTGLLPFVSNDGLHWRQASEHPAITDGKFDSQNVAFWDGNRGEYRAYYRDLPILRPAVPSGEDTQAEPAVKGCRGIKTASSPDFMHWTPGQWLTYRDVPDEQLYTNQIFPCPRAPHILIGFPTRYLPDRGSIVEGLLMSSRDGLSFQRWQEAFLRPGLNRERWGNRSNYIWNGLIETPSDIPGAPNEWSLYSTEGYYEGAQCRTRRFTLRLDGMVSVNAPMAGGELVTRVLTFTGSRLMLNMSTSAAGAIHVEIQDPQGRPVPGYDANACDTIWGDCVDRPVTWNGRSDLDGLAGEPVRLRFVLADADLYSFLFCQNR